MAKKIIAFTLSAFMVFSNLTTDIIAENDESSSSEVTEEISEVVSDEELSEESSGEQDIVEEPVVMEEDVVSEPLIEEILEFDEQMGLEEAESAESLMEEVLKSAEQTSLEEVPQDEPVEEFTVVATARENGSIDPFGEFTAVSGEEITFTVSPDEGYILDEATVNDEMVEVENNQFTVTVLEALTVLVTFVEDPNAEPAPVPDVTRAVWVYDLVDAFGMTVEEDNYPDNYYNDIDDRSPYYRTIMVATEFGILDIEAGGDFRPDDGVTREFAAQTLNYAMGIQFDGTEYSFSDWEDVNYPKDAQVAIDRGWLELIDGEFKPGLFIATAERDTMIQDAQANGILADIDPNHENVFSFDESVKVLPERTDIVFEEDGTVTLRNSPVEISSEDVIAVFVNDIPVVYDVVAVTGDTEEYVMAVENSDDISYSHIDAQGILDGSEAVFIPADSGVIVHDAVINEDTSAHMANVLSSQLKTGSFPEKQFSKSVKLSNGTEASISVTLVNGLIEYIVDKSNSHYYVKFSADAQISANVTMDVLSELAINKNIPLGKYQVGILGLNAGIELGVDLNFKGKLTYDTTVEVVAGFDYNNGTKRLIKNFKKKSTCFKNTCFWRTDESSFETK